MKRFKEEIRHMKKVKFNYDANRLNRFNVPDQIALALTYLDIIKKYIVWKHRRGIMRLLGFPIIVSLISYPLAVFVGSIILTAGFLTEKEIVDNFPTL